MRKLRIDSVRGGLRGDDPRWPKLLEDDIYDLLTLTPIRAEDLLAILARVKRRVSALPALRVD